MVATSKPEPYAVSILEHFAIAQYFTLVAGSRMDGSMILKSELIEHILNHTDSSPGETVMIGDRLYDIEGARANGVISVGVRYGYAEANEIDNACPDFTVNDVSELSFLLGKMSW